MSKIGGFIFIFDEYKRRSEILEHLRRSKTFTDAVSVKDWGTIREAICLLSFDGDTFSHLAVAKGGRKFVTFKRVVEFSHIIELRQLSIADVEERLPKSLQHHFVRMSQGMGQPVPLPTWRNVMKTVKGLRPELAEVIARLEALVERGPESFTGNAYEILAQEKDAVATALSLFGNTRRTELVEWSPPTDDALPQSFLAGLMAEKPTEDDIIGHDAGVFGPLWTAVKKDVCGIAVFERGNDTLWVFNANRKKLEHSLGVDLLYFHQTFSSYALVQYKRMEKENEDGEPVFRITENTSYTDEIKRMRTCRDNHPDQGPGGSIDAYRLSPEAFFFRLCWSAEFEPFSRKLLPGYYVPLGLWDIYEASDSILGPKNGKRLTLSNMKRYLWNTDFVRLVENGWLGSRGDMTHAVDVLVGRVEVGVDVVVAVGQAGNPFQHRRLSRYDFDWEDDEDFDEPTDDKAVALDDEKTELLW